MEQVFAPWRIDWVEREEQNDDIEGCVFCALPNRPTAADRENNLLARGEHAYVLMNNYPYNPGHLMVIPYEHARDFRDLSEPAQLELMTLKGRCLDALEDAMGPEGCNVGYNLGGESAGGSIEDHVHAHVVPRWTGDTNFMPVVSDTKVIVEAVTDSYDRLHEALADQDGARTTDRSAAVRLD